MLNHHHILIAGGSGMIGSRLTQMLVEMGCKVSALSRRKKNQESVKTFQWDVEHDYIDINALKGVTAIINLAGQGIADKAWSLERKKELLNSRIKSTRLLFNTLKNTTHTVNTFINASAIGIYKSGNEPLYEDSACGSDFLSQICQEWENEALKIQSLNIRTIVFRIGLVMSGKGGMLKEMLMPMKFFIAPVFANGNQWQSWIHKNDLCRMFVFAIENKNIVGVYNAVAPKPVSNVNLVRSIQAAVKNVTFKIRIPEFALKIALGERTEMLLSSHNVSCQKITNAGFEFHFSNSADAVMNCVNENN